MEQDLGLKLYYKSANRILLTEEGRQIYDVASAMYDEANRLASVAERDQVSGMVSITCVSSVFSEVIAPALPAFLARNRGLRISVLSTDSNKSISSHEADIAIRLGRSRSENLVSTRIARIGYSLYSSAGHPISESHLMNDELDWIAYNEEYMDVPEMRWMKRHMKRRIPVLRTTSGAGYAAAIANGIGVGIMPIYRQHKYHPLHPILKSRSVVSREVWVVTLPLHSLGEPARVVLNWIREVMKTLA